MVGVVVAALLISYVGNYYRLTRRGYWEADQIGVDGFYYVPIAEIPTREGQWKNYQLANWYAPLNWIDRHLFGRRSLACGIWRLSG